MSFDSLLNRRCTIEVKTSTQNADSGQMIESWGVLLSAIKCRLDIKSGGKIVGAESVYEKASHILFMRKPASVVLTTEDYRIDIDGDKYEIILVNELYSNKPFSHYELLLDKTEPQ